MTTTHKVFWFFALCLIIKIVTAVATPMSAAEAQALAAQKAEDTRKGFHCLSSYNGSHRGVVKYVKENLRDPDSYDHIETRITPISKEGEHVLVMKYRAKNGFGGMNVESVIATVKNDSCQATIM
jgi:hypothetical protein